MKAKLYVAGPMTGHYNFNKTAFIKAAETLQARGYEPVTPFDVPEEAERLDDIGGASDWSTPTQELAWFLREDFKLLLDCDGIALLDGWQESRGANMELLVAVATGRDRYRFYEDSELLRRASVLPRTDIVNGFLHEVASTDLVSLWN